MRSRFCTTAHLQTDQGALPYLAYSSLSGNVTLIDELCHALLDDGGRNGVPCEQEPGIQERLTFLRERGYAISEEGLEEAAAAELTRGIKELRRQLLQLLFVFHPDESGNATSSAAIDAAISALPRLIERFGPKKCHLHFWIFEPSHAELFRHVIERVMTVFPEQGAKDGGDPAALPDPTFVINTNGMLPVNVRPLCQRSATKVLLKVVVDRRFMDPFTSLDAYLGRLYAFIEQAASEGQSADLFLNATRGSEDLFSDVLLERFMETGLNRAVVTHYYLSAVLPKMTPADFHCDIDRIDWDLWHDLLPKLASRPRYRMFTFYGGGIVSKFQRLLDLKKTLVPDITFCPIVANAIAFDLAGNLWCCPKTALRGNGGNGGSGGNGLEPVGRYLPDLHIDEQRLRAWWDWNVRDLPGCVSCPDALLCGGGCPLVARENGLPRCEVDKPCQPVREFLCTGVRENLTYLARRFGPA